MTTAIRPQRPSAASQRERPLAQLTRAEQRVRDEQEQFFRGTVPQYRAAFQELTRTVYEALSNRRDLGGLLFYEYHDGVQRDGQGRLLSNFAKATYTVRVTRWKFFSSDFPGCIVEWVLTEPHLNEKRKPATTVRINSRVPPKMREALIAEFKKHEPSFLEFSSDLEFK